MRPTTGVADGFDWQAGPAGRVLTSRLVGALAPHVFTARELEWRGAEGADSGRRLANLFSLPADRLVRAKQVHGRAVFVVRPGVAIDAAPAADAIVSVDPNRAVVVFVADCVPVLIADRRHRAVAAVHAGWRGTAASVTRAAVDAMASLGAPPEDLVAAIGPSIGPCCYQVDAPVRDAFLERMSDADRWFVPDGPGRWKLDLWWANADQLVDAGLSANAVQASRLCSMDHPDDCWSYRRDGGGTGRMAAAIALRRFG